MTSEAPTRQTQAQRSASTRAKVLDATVDALIEVGYSKTTTQEVNRRAGVSRGALLHQFPTKDDLVVAAVGHLVDRRLTELLNRDRAGDEDIDIFVSIFDGPLFYAALELWVAGRTDPALRDELIGLERKMSDAIALGAAELFGDRYTPEQIELTVELARGLAISRILRTPEADAALNRRLMPLWKDLLP